MARRKTNRTLVDYAISRLGTGYLYGTYGKILTPEILSAKLRQYPTKVQPHLEYIRKQWMGKPVQDCVGLIKGHYWTDDEGRIVYRLDKLPDLSANGLFDAATKKGPIAELPDTRGILLWKKGHVGVYVGDEEVVEAHGSLSGVIRTKLHETKWTHWFECSFIDYVPELVGSYVVKKGDSLWALSKKFLRDGRRYTEIARDNGILPPYTIFPGQVLEIAGFVLYAVQPGDSPWKIAQKELGDGKRYPEIVRLNDLKEPYVLRVGQALTLPRK